MTELAAFPYSQRENEHFLKECTQKYVTEKKRSSTKYCDAYMRLRE